MKNSLFNYVKSYIPTVDRNPREDYLTQVFSYVLSNTSTAPAFCDFLLNKMKSIYVMHADDDIKVETQVTVANGRIDMLVRAGQSVLSLAALTTTETKKEMDWESRRKNRSLVRSINLKMAEEWKEFLPLFSSL